MKKSFTKKGSGVFYNLLPLVIISIFYTTSVSAQCTVSTQILNGGSPNLCSNSITVTAALGNDFTNPTYRWKTAIISGNSGFALFADDEALTTSVAGLLPGTVAIYLRVTDPTCGVINSDTLTLTIGDAPTAAAVPIGNTTLCEGETLDLVGFQNGPNVYAWSTEPALPTSVFSSLDGTNTTFMAPSITAEQETFNIVYAATNGLCSDTFLIPITINKRPDVAVAAPVEVCSGDPIELIVTNPNSLSDTMRWYGNYSADPLTGSGAGVGGTIRDTFYNFSNTPITAFYNVFVKNDNCVSDTAMAEIIINPISPTYQVTGGEVTDCADAAPTVTVGVDNSQLGTTYELFLNGITTGNTVVGTGSPISFGVQSNAGIYTVKSTNTSCPSTIMDGTASLIINPNPSVSTNDIIINAGTTLTLDATSSDNVTYSWTGPNNFSSSDQNPTVTNNVQSIHLGDYVVEVTDDKGCKDSKTLNVSFNVTCIADAGLDQSTPCNATVLKANEVNASEVGTWSIVDTDGSHSFGDVNNPESTFSGTVGETYTLKWIVSGGSCGTTPMEDQVEITFASGLDLNDIPIPTGTYEASGELTSRGTVANSTEVHFRAGEQILLLPGFTVVAGATFTAQIAPCAPLQQMRVAPTVIQPISTTNLSVTTDFSIRPNPFTIESKIDLSLIKAESVTISIVDQNGRLIKRIVEDQVMEAGNHTFAITEDQLPNGLLYIALTTPSTQLVKKVILIKDGRPFGSND